MHCDPNEIASICFALQSYFYYLRKFVSDSEFLKHTCTVAQYQAVRDNDLERFLKLLHVEGGGRGLQMPWQYKVRCVVGCCC